MDEHIKSTFVSFFIFDILELFLVPQMQIWTWNLEFKVIEKDFTLIENVKKKQA